MLTRFKGGVATPWSAAGLPKGINEVLERFAETMVVENAKQLRNQHALTSGTPTIGGYEKNMVHVIA